ncbi:MAG: two-component regulator propeller domain-containing protein [Bacteroidota bacterium]
MIYHQIKGRIIKFNFTYILYKLLGGGRILIVFGLLFLCRSSHLLNAQNFDLSAFHLQVEGEPFNKRVNVLFEDSFGYLWIGTNAGLFRYDGNQLKAYQYDVFDNNTIPNNTINSIVEDDFQNLWIGSESFLIFFDRKKEIFKRYFKSYTAECFAKTEEGAIWANLKGLGLLKIKPHEHTDSIQLSRFYQIFSTTKENEEVIIYGIIQDEYKRTLISTSKGIGFLNEQYQFERTNVSSALLDLQKGTENSVWGIKGKHIIQYKYFKDKYDFEALDSVTILEEAVSPLEVNSFCISPKNHLWVGTTKGLYRTDLSDPKSIIKPINSNKTSMDGRINDVEIDRFNNLWIGSWKGVEKIVDRAEVFQYVNLREIDPSITHDRTNAIFQDEYNQVWIGTGVNGLFRYNLSSGKFLGIPTPSQNITFLQKGWRQDGLLMGCGRQFFRISQLQSPIPNIELVYEGEKSISGVLQLNDSDFLVGIWGQGVKFVTNQPLADWQIDLENITANNHVSTLFQSEQGDIWIGTRGQGLYRIAANDRKVYHFIPGKTEGVSSDAFLSITESQNGTIWMGTRGGGVLRYDVENDEFQSFNKSDGLPSTTIASVEFDHHNNLWIGTENGIAYKKNGEPQFFSFRSEDGVSESNFVYNAGCSIDDGKVILMGTYGGYYTITADNFYQKNNQANTVITSLSTFGEQNEPIALDISDHIVLPFKRNNINIRFSSLDLTAPNKNQYAYMLEGVNDYWIPLDNNVRSAAFFDLSPGEYIFHVKSSNSDGVWNEQAARLRIQILPPFYRSYLAYSIYVLLFLALVYGLFKVYRRWYSLKQNLLEQKVSRQKDQQHHKMRMVFFTDISHELRTPLTLILNTIETLMKKGDRMISKQSLDRIQSNSNKMNDLINQLMDIRKHGEGEFKLKVQEIDLKNYFKSMITSFSDLAKNSNIQLTFEAKQNINNGFMDCFISEKIATNLLSNAIKYTLENGTIHVSISEVLLRKNDIPNFNLQGGHYCQLTIYDTGIGMMEEDLEHVFDRYYQTKNVTKAHLKGTGIGMELVHKLVLLHHGAITINSKKDLFTRVDVYLPLEANHYAAHEILKSQVAVSPYAPNMAETHQAERNPSFELPTASKDKTVDILIVEDNEELLQMMYEMLSKEYQTEVAIDGLDGLEKAKAYLPKVIITDIKMPGINGQELLENLKKEETTTHIPVFILTASSNEAFKQDCIQLGASDFIKKPFSMDFLCWKIKNALQYQDKMIKKYGKYITAVPSEISLESPDEQLIQNIIQVIEENISNPELSVVFLAEQVNMSRANLYRKLQKLTNETPVAFIKKIRLQRAEQILITDKFYISEVAHMCGFKTLKYFSKCFQKAYGCAPSVYVQRVLGKDEVKT